jgi:hypothetical protein
MDHCLADGQIGPGTIATLKAYLAKRPTSGEEVLLKALNASRASATSNSPRRTRTSRRSLYGWLANRVSMSL